MKLCVFSKHFQSMDAEKLGKTISSEFKLDGVDLTVRNNGHIKPSDVKSELSRFKDILNKYGLDILMLTTEIVDINLPESLNIVETAGKLGIKYIKLGYWKYKGFGHYYEQEKEVKKALSNMEPVFRDNGVKAGFHCHSDCMGLNANYTLRLMEDCDPNVIGVYYDIGHNTIEGSSSGWIMDLDLAFNRLFMVAIKNRAWYFMGNSSLDEDRKGWVVKTVPIENGIADIPKFVKLLKQISFNGIVSFHSEYQGHFTWCNLTNEEVVEQTKKDISYFRSLLKLVQNGEKKEEIEKKD